MRQSLVMAEIVSDLTPEQKKRISVHRNDLLWVVTAVLALFIVIALALLNWRGVQAANRRAADTRELAGYLRRILQLTDEAETGQRGFLLTAEDTYLEPYTNATQKLSPEISKLQSNVEGRQYQRQINDLRQLI